MEIKVYTMVTNFIRNYFAFECYYKENSYDQSDTMYENPKYLKAHRYNKYINCLTVKYGFLVAKKHSFVIDYYFGIGVRFKNVSSGLSDHEAENTYHSHDPSGALVDRFRDESGKKIRPNLEVGIKLGFRIK